MLKSVFYPNKANSYAWANVFLLIVLVAIGKVEAYAILFGYFLETIIIGIFNIFKMYLAYRHNDKKASIFGTIVFFIMHYGGFVAIQSIFLFAIFSFGKNSFINEPFNIIENFEAVMKLDGMDLILTILVGTQLIKFILDFLMPKKYELFTVNEIMFKPYFRIFIQQFTVIIGSFFIVFSEGSVMAAMLLIFLRFIVDFLFVAIREDSKFLGYVINRIYNGKVSKPELKKQLLLITE
ncbi:DUF6498-containing protein [Winogradskyella ursingii]|uniref:DUF6498-containing protein n=1 Tax=Winogradskyella ursingii TaxID=2686079 RepID=UPI0015CE7842|nr:DUF6498-containing protein [Winogradskyella ursingii]